MKVKKKRPAPPGRDRSARRESWPPPARHRHEVPAARDAAAPARRADGPAPSVTPHDPALLDRVRDAWLASRWQDVAALPPGSIGNHPERAWLAAYQATALQQLGDRHAARAVARQALAWGIGREELGRALLAGVRHTLGRASILARRERQADAHLERAVVGARLSSEIRRHALARRDHLEGELQAAVRAAETLRHQGAQPAAVKAPAWIAGLAERCCRAADLHDSVDRAMDTLLTLDDDRLQFLLLLAEQMLTRGDRLTALHFLNSARWLVDGASPELRIELMRRLLALGAAESAMDVAVRSGLDAVEVGAGTDMLKAALIETYRKVRQAAQARTEHGHELLLAQLEARLPALKPLAGQRALTLVEIGTTREDVPGQGSTLKLAEFCLRHGLKFVTVDMDPHNARLARQTFQRLGAAGFEAVTAKGEDYLRKREGPIDFVFLDAYDFDHGKHSELRQSRYQKYLGARIDEQACHRMHLDCAETLAGKLWAHGLICIDDTWLDDGRWSAKGTLAMPYLLEHGFELVEARNRAALLARQQRPGTAADASAPAKGAAA